MAKDYFQDIVPPQNGAQNGTPRPARKLAVPQQQLPDPELDDFTDEEEVAIEPPAPERSIRNIPLPQSRSRGRAMPDAEQGAAPRTFAGQDRTAPTRARSSRGWIWILAGVLVVFVGTLAVVATRGTVVTVTPHSHLVTFDQTAQFTAYPANTAATGTLSYTIRTIELEEFAVVPAQGTQHVETKASGSLTLFNDYQATPVKLIKGTRFESPDGLIFRIPADVSIPGKTAAGPGKVDVTVQADQVGEKYNLAPTTRFTVPGLKGGPMYDKVYASSASAMSGGFAGEQPGVEPGALAAAVADIRTRIEQKAREALATTSEGFIAFPGLASVVYQDLPATTEAEGSVRIGQKAIISYAAFPADMFATVIAQSVSADVAGSRIVIKPGEGYGAAPVTSGTSTPTLNGTGPLPFALMGKALLVWTVDAAELQKALAGRDQAAFQTIITGFPSIEEAHARIEPFWKSTFPADSTQIGVTVKDVEIQ